MYYVAFDLSQLSKMYFVAFDLLQVSTVERLENPNLWEMYCTHRERLIRRLEQEQHGQAFTPVERLKGSSKAVRTTSILNRHSRLSREMFPQVSFDLLCRLPFVFFLKGRFVENLCIIAPCD